MKVLKKFSLNDGGAIFGIDACGNIVVYGGNDRDGNETFKLELTAGELDRIASAVDKRKVAIEAFLSVMKKHVNIPEMTRFECHDIGFVGEYGEGEIDEDVIVPGVALGCQWIKAEDVEKVHRESKLIRQRVRASRQRKASRK